MKKLKIVIIGGTGFIGRTLSKDLLDAGYWVTVLSRRSPPDSSLKHDIAHIHADVMIPGRWQELIPDYEVVINLAGVSIFRRWTARGKQEILNSRIIAAINIVDA
jgi:NAD dependent epimerase/dehydratase family enzyme